MIRIYTNAKTSCINFFNNLPFLPFPNTTPLRDLTPEGQVSFMASMFLLIIGDRGCHLCMYWREETCACVCEGYWSAFCHFYPPVVHHTSAILWSARCEMLSMQSTDHSRSHQKIQWLSLGQKFPLTFSHGIAPQSFSHSQEVKIHERDGFFKHRGLCSFLGKATLIFSHSVQLIELSFIFRVASVLLSILFLCVPACL